MAKTPRFRAQTYGQYFGGGNGHLIVKRSEMATILVAEREFMKLYVQEHGWLNRVKRALLRIFAKKTRIIPMAAVKEDMGDGPVKPKMPTEPPPVPAGAKLTDPKQGVAP